MNKKTILTLTASILLISSPLQSSKKENDIPSSRKIAMYSGAVIMMKGGADFLDLSQKLFWVTRGMNVGFDRRFGPQEICAMLSANFVATVITCVAGALVFNWGKKAEGQE